MAGNAPIFKHGLHRSLHDVLLLQSAMLALWSVLRDLITNKHPTLPKVLVQNIPCGKLT